MWSKKGNLLMHYGIKFPFLAYQNIVDFFVVKTFEYINFPPSKNLL